MKKFHIEGMSCTACSNSIERVTRKLESVTSSNVNLISKTLYIEYDENILSPALIISTIEKAGFKAYLIDDNIDKNKSIKESSFKEINIGPSLKTRLISSFILIVILTYFSMDSMLNLYIPFKNIPLIPSLIEAILALFVILINIKFYVNGFKTIISKSPNMDTLISLGSFFSYVYGIIEIILYINSKDESYLKSLYFDSSAMILFFITIGKTFENKAKKKTNFLVESLKELVPSNCLILKNDKEELVNIKDVNVGDTIIVKEGESIPLDGIIIKGDSLIDESTLTGESNPIFKTKGDIVYSSTINTNGYLLIEVKTRSEESTLSKMIEQVNFAGSTKANIERLADRISLFFVPTIITISFITLIVRLIITKEIEPSINHAIQVLVISCPCALGLATPLSITASIGLSAKRGILIKEATAFEILNKADIFVFDKTGTLTLGKPTIKKILTYNNSKEDDLIIIAKSIEKSSSHPLSYALKNYRNDLKEIETNDYKVYPGLGLFAIIRNNKILLGSEKLLQDNNIEVNKTSEIGTSIYISSNDKHIGTIILDDEIRKESKEIIDYLNKSNYEVAVLSGDNYNSTIKLRDCLNIPVAYDSVNPFDKERIIKETKEQKTVIYIGDGINDSIALKVSSLGISISGAKGIALDASSVVLLKGNLESIPDLLNISKRTVRIIKQNLFWAFFYNILMIPIAIGLYEPIGLVLTPVLCSISMSISSLIVVLNSLRLKKYKGNKNENRS